METAPVEYHCPFCGEVMQVKNSLLFCPQQKIFIGKMENYSKWSDSPSSVTIHEKKGGFSTSASDFASTMKIVLFLITIGIGFVAYYHYLGEFPVGSDNKKNTQTSGIEERVINFVDTIFPLR